MALFEIEELHLKCAKCKRGLPELVQGIMT